MSYPDTVSYVKNFHSFILVMFISGWGITLRKVLINVTSWINIKLQKNLYLNFENIKEDTDLIGTSEQALRLVKAETKSSIKILINFSGAALGSAFMGEAKKLGKEIVSMKTTKTAIYGMSNLQKILLHGYVVATGSKSKLFSSKSDAEEYLIRD